MTRKFLWTVALAVWGAVSLGQRVNAQDATHPVTDVPHSTPASTIDRGPQASDSYDRDSNANNTSDQQLQQSNMRSQNDQQSSSDQQSSDGMNERSSNSANDRTQSSNDRNRTNDRQPRDWQSQIRFGEQAQNGLRIESIQRGTPFYRSGLREGDVLISYDGEPIRTRDDFRRAAVYRPGERVPFVILSDGQRQTVYINYPSDRDQNQSYDNESGSYGSEAFLGVQFDQRGREGAVIASVLPGSAAEQAGLRRGDELVSINGHEIGSPREASRVVGSMQSGDRIDIEFSRRVHNQTQAVLGSRNNQAQTAQYNQDRSEVQAYRGGPDDDRADQASYDQTNEPNWDRNESDQSSGTYRNDNSSSNSQPQQSNTNRRGGRLLPRLRD
jgi:C-terminal processing protease CtpA/Prc